jgi:hypothetical protein
VDEQDLENSQGTTKIFLANSVVQIPGHKKAGSGEEPAF